MKSILIVALMASTAAQAASKPSPIIPMPNVAGPVSMKNGATITPVPTGVTITPIPTGVTITPKFIGTITPVPTGVTITPKFIGTITPVPTTPVPVTPKPMANQPVATVTHNAVVIPVAAPKRKTIEPDFAVRSYCAAFDPESRSCSNKSKVFNLPDINHIETHMFDQ